MGQAPYPGCCRRTDAELSYMRDTESSERQKSLASFSSHLFTKVPFKDVKFYADLATCINYNV